MLLPNLSSFLQADQQKVDPDQLPVGFNILLGIAFVCLIIAMVSLYYLIKFMIKHFKNKEQYPKRKTLNKDQIKEANQRHKHYWIMKLKLWYTSLNYRDFMMISLSFMLIFLLIAIIFVGGAYKISHDYLYNV